MSARTYLVTLGLAVTATAAFATSGVLTAAGTNDKAPVTSTSAPAAKTAATKTAAKPKATVTCTGGNTKVVVTKLTRPANHWLITATNTGKNLCNAYYAPFLGFEHDQSTTTIIEGSQPQAVVTLAPGESAYAGFTTASANGSGSNPRTAHDLTIYFSGRSSDGGSVGKAAHWIFKPGVRVDDSAKVTYWQSSISDAINW
ncbi:DUF4232 domain-containing protein [Kribbella antibiotica]|uniref:DUF4232 domain-containing protein n=1 Tax=Kribbella antibiotica TaxID=190195 RepID=A0A4R4ZI40_9ACTN|nr:DUF4232 domain-containing protein [Kribbella antibiotica]TDD57706.1 DUF4232 domain-containing protein [Kribbella antibiotica]